MSVDGAPKQIKLHDDDDEFRYDSYDVSDEQRQLISAMIDEEMASFEPDHDAYLSHLSHYKNPFRTQLIRNELNDLAKNADRPPSSQLALLKVDSPPTSGADLESWTKILNQLKVKLEYSQKQLINLDLLKTNGLQMWKQVLPEFERSKSSLERYLIELRKQLDESELKDDEKQENILKELNQLEDIYKSYIEQNKFIAKEIARLKNH